ncbi:MAG: cytochrome c [Polyangiaceae bacterium]|nr:cytochrome c [Polyangiaceae bacterium]
MRLPWCLLLPLLLAGCDREPTRPWTPSDHDGNAEAPPTTRADPAEARAQVIEVSWGRQCASCHGAVGRGDGPSGPMVQAPDLTRPAWQDTVSDEQIAKVIREGRGRMPRFDLPPEVVAGLVQRIRQARGR